ncbi:hypothetical protein AAG906_013124 [Vitis piasezkii]
MSNQIAADGQTEITHMDADLYEALYESDIRILERKYSEAHLQLQQTPKRNTVLHIAAQFAAQSERRHSTSPCSLLDAAKTLHREIESGVGTDKAMLRMTNKEKDTALHEAVRLHSSLHGCRERIWRLGVGIMGRTALHAAVIREDQDKSSDKSETYLAIKDTKKTALYFAANRHHRETVKLLLSHTPDLDKMALNDDKLTALDILSRANIKSGQIVTTIFFVFNQISETEKQMKEWEKVVVGPFSWQEATNKDNGSSSKTKTSEKTKAWLSQRLGETHLIVATLVATVSCAAGFTLPGGDNDSDGMAKLTKQVAFKAFIVTDTLAMMLSVSAVFVYFVMSLHKDEDILAKQLVLGTCLTMSSVVLMVVAFVTGLSAVLPSSSGLLLVVCISWYLFLIIVALTLTCPFRIRLKIILKSIIKVLGR